MENHTSRIIIFAVSLLVIMVTASLLIEYFNTAKEVVTKAGNREDIATNFDNIINNSDKSSLTVSGLELRSLIRKYAGDDSVMIMVDSMPDVNNNWCYIEKNGAEERITNIIDEAKLSIISTIDNYELLIYRGVITEIEAIRK